MFLDYGRPLENSLRRTRWFLVALTVGVVGFFVVALASPAFVTPSQSGGMMGAGGMMSWWMPYSGSQYSYPSSMWLLPVAMLTLIVIGAVGLIYGIAVPEIRTVGAVHATTHPSEGATQPSIASEAKGPMSTAPSEGNTEAMLMTLKPDERKVLDVLRSHEGKYLQKWIVKETGMSRLQVHRVIARLAERNVVEVKAVGNTNEVSLAQWMAADVTK